MNTLPAHARRIDIQDAANSFATDILCLPSSYTEGKRMLVAVGRALNAKQLPTKSQATFAWLAWRKFSGLLVGYQDECARLYQLYNLSEAEFRDEIMKVIAVKWAEKKWRVRR